MMVSILKLVLVCGAALGLFHFNTGDSTNLFQPPNNTNISALQLQPGYDHFLLALRLPVSFCQLQTDPKCNPDPPLAAHQNTFTIHGLWPQCGDGSFPTFCSPSDSMTDNTLTLFYHDLLLYWPDLLYAQNFQSSMYFWRWEWNKHGSCSSNNFNPPQYLAITINLTKNHAQNIFNGLVNQGVIERNGIIRRGKADIEKAVENITGRKNPIAVIVQGLLLEIRLCVNQAGNALIDCNPSYMVAAT